MSSDRRSPWWPYLLVLAGLFVLSLAVPRGWQTVKIEPRGERWLPQTVAAKPQSAPVRPVVVQPMPEPVQSELNQAIAQQSRYQPAEDRSFQASPVGPAAAPAHVDPVDSYAEIKAQIETVMPKIASAARFLAGRRKFDRTPAVSQAPLQSDNHPQSTTRELASVLTRRTTATVVTAQPEVVTWPMPQRLIEQLDHLTQHLETREWAVNAKQLCEALAQTPVDQPREALAIVGQLQTLADQANAVAGQISDGRVAAEFRRAQYALQRRLVAWNLAAKASDRPTIYANVRTAEVQYRQVAISATEVRNYLETIPHGDAWIDYLALDEIRRLTSAGPKASIDESRTIARRVLNLLWPHDASPAQRRVLTDRSIQALAEQLQTLAADAIDSREVLAGIERYEATRLPSDALALVAAQQRLIWSASKTDQALAQHLENHYRNANVRVAIGKEMYERLAPEPVTTYGQVNDTIVGTPVHGQSVNTIEFQVKLVPDPRRIHLWFEAYGMVNSRTQSSSGPATVSNRGSANFIVRKAMLLDEKGLGIGQASTEADTRSQLTGIRTSVDGIPLIGSMVRGYAESQYDEMREQARWEAREKVAAQAGQRVDLEVNKRLNEVEERVKREVLNPLANMGLELDPIAMETQAERTTMRLRLAGQHQLGGHTARPQAPSDSLASVQLHESALNNVLDQLQLSGRTFELPQLYKHLAQRASRPEPKLPADLPDGVTITFADRNPLRIRCEDDKLRLTLAIKELRQGSKYWHDFSITTTYKPEVNGRQAKLVRDGIIDLNGEAYKGKPEVALRGIFSKILSRERKFDLVPPMIVDHPRMTDLCVTQCTIEDGWIGIALGPDRNVVRSNVARRPATGTMRK